MKFYDITESAEELYNNAPCGYFSALTDGTFIKINDTLLKWTGYNREELLYKIKWSELLSTGGKIYYETHFAPLLKMQSFVKEISLELKKKDGTTLPILINSELINNGKQEFTRSVVLDVTQRRLYEKELLIAKRRAEELVLKLSRSNTELEQFARVVSHDLQNPLQSIQAFMELIEMNNRDILDEESKQYIRIIFDSIGRMSGLIKDLLEYSGIATVENISDPVNLNETWNYLTKIFAKNIKENNAQLIVPELPTVKGNKSQVTRLFQNLLSNSLKYRSERHPVIQISYEDSGEYWKFYFKDNGIGFDQKYAEEVFMFSSRLENDEKYTGYGIGLASCKKIIEMHNGAIGVISTEGKGSTFYFTLPKYIRNN